MHDPTLTIDGVRVPRFLYGTAWKEQETRRLTELALHQGSRGIDTANQRRDYDEAAVGQAVAAAADGGVLARAEDPGSWVAARQPGRIETDTGDSDVPCPTGHVIVRHPGCTGQVTRCIRPTA